jgi:hypothetical protein
MRSVFRHFFFIVPRLFTITKITFTFEPPLGSYSSKRDPRVTEAPSVATPAVPAPATFKKSLRVNFTGKTRHPTRDAGKEPPGHPARFVVDHAPCDVVVLRYAAVRNASAWSRPPAGDRRRSPHVVLPRRGRGFVREIPFRCEFCPNRGRGSRKRAG